MRRTPSGIGFSATDLSDFLSCAHRTTLELAVQEGALERPAQNDIERRLLEKRGLEHEREVLEHYRRVGKAIVTIAAAPGAEGIARAAAETLEAMSAGAEVIYQAAFVDGAWTGRPDFLVKAPGGARWPHHYEVTDAKLAREAKARAVLQLCVYTDQVTRLQGHAPRHFHIAGGADAGAPIPLLAADYMAYYRDVRRRLEGFVAQAGPTYPEPVEHCGVCPWWKRCEERRRADDHLSLVAGITRRQRDRLGGAGVARVTELGALAPDRAIDGIADEALTRVREQARLQVAGRAAGQPIYELLASEDPTRGLGALPTPTPGDLFLDLEGDSFVGEGGLEYLFGLVELGPPEDGFTVRKAPGPPRYQGWWATDAASEKRAFEQVLARIRRGRDEFYNLHVFHFGHRETDALKRLSCRHKTGEAEVDQLLREHVLVDLLPIVRHSLRASVEGYTLKQLEPLHGFQRAQELRGAARAMLLFGWWLETGDEAVNEQELRQQIQSYNDEDCRSTHSLREWLEARRPEWEARAGTKLPRPKPDAKPASDERIAKSAETARLGKRLLAGLPADPAADGEPERARRLMADLLDWHWREAKSGWWEYHRARELAPEERVDDRASLGGLVYEGVVEKVRTALVHRYRFPEQEHAVRSKPSPIDPETQKGAGTVVAIGPRHIDLRRPGSSAAPHPTALIPGKPIATDPQESSLLALGESVAAGDGAFAAARALLLRAAPALPGAPANAPLVGDEEGIEPALARLALGLDGSVLAVQGPPGSGKTHQAALMILALIAAGKRVGVTANSHTVIRSVLWKVAALASGARVRALHIEDESPEDPETAPFEIESDKQAALRRLRAGELDLVGGTSWTWAHANFASAVDVLVVDEAGQMSLANVLAVSRAARSLILFGDPAQLEQPQKGVHPIGADVSALEHLLGGDALTIPADRGVFMPRTRRLHPAICDFISKVFYEGRLHPEPGLGLDRQAVSGPGIFQGAGLRHVPVVHRGNTNQSLEEAEAIRALVGDLLASSATFTDRDGNARPLTAADVLVVTPYNAQVAALTRALPPAVRVGTVDKFQGQEAPIVIYSMATSSGDDAPRGLDFLYSLNRLNVAVSRAQALAVLVASPALTRVSCRTPRQMKLVNALCAYLERV